LHLFKKSSLFILSVTLTACAVGPDFLRPSAPKVSNYTHGSLPQQTASIPNVKGAEAQHFDPAAKISADWWKLYASEPLNKLINQALTANPDLKAAEASLKEAQENVYAAEGAFLPSFNLNETPTREKFSPASFGLPGKSSIFTIYNTNVSVSYGLDIFGGSRREVEALQAQAEYQQFQLQAARISLTANVATTYIQQASLQEQIRETENIIKLEKEQLTILQNQFNLGAIPKTAVLSQQTTLAQVEATLPGLRKSLTVQQHQLAVLTGHFPDELADDESGLDTLYLPTDLPLTIPSDLVSQRPDIRESEALLHAASAQIGVATANMLPQLNITGSYGSSALKTSDIFTKSNEVWNIAGGLTQPLFHGGTLFHERRAAVDAFKVAAAQYQGTVLKSFQNVADVLRALQYDAETLVAQNQAADAAKNSLDLARSQFKEGAISYLTLLDSERQYEQTDLSLIQAQAARYADTAALFQALGGGWWNQPQTAKDSKNTREKK